jgi:DNA (cytosine-5)-methyltransferase 1
LGLDAAGWETVFSNQWEPSTKTQHASSCYVAKFGTAGHSNEDIKVVLDRFEEGSLDLPDADIIVGGFPCQDYSVAKSLNSSKGLEGKKGVLWWEIHRLVAAKKPKFVFLENVDRLLKSPASQRGRDFAIMLRTLGDLGYRVEWRVVNAAEEGFPQRRIRVFIVAARDDVALALPGLDNPEKYLTTDGILGKSFPATSAGQLQHLTLEKDPEKLTTDFNTVGASSPFLTAGVMQGDEVYTLKTKSANIKRGLTLGDVLEKSDSVPDEYWIDEAALRAWEYLKGAKSITRVHTTSGTEYKYSEGKMAFPDSLDKPSRTILTGEGGATPSRFKHVIKVDGKYRRLLPIELERLNGFPDNWTKTDSTGKTLADARRAFFMGNALVVGLVERVGLVLASIMQNVAGEK